MSEIDIEEMEALLIVDSYHDVQFELILEQVKFSARNSKNIILARKISEKEYMEISRVCKENSVKLVEAQRKPFKWEKNISGIQNINVPIIAIIENGERCNAFEIEMQIVFIYAIIR